MVLSLVYPSSDPAVAAQLRALRAGLPPGTPVLVGGAAAPSHAEVLGEVEARVLEDDGELRVELDALAAA